MIGTDTVSSITLAIIVVAMVLDLHNGYVSRILNPRIPKGLATIVLRAVTALATASFAYSLLESLVGEFVQDSLVSVAVSIVTGVSISLAMRRRDKAGVMLAIGIEEVKSELRQLLTKDREIQLAEKKQEKEAFSLLLNSFTKEVLGKIESIRMQIETLSAKVRSFLTQADQSLSLMVDMDEKLEERVQTIAYLVEQLRALRDSLSALEQPATAPASKVLTSEDGKNNRMKGLEAQRELEDMLRSWGAMIQTAYAQGKPDIIVVNGNGPVAVVACKAYTLSPARTKQRTISRDDIQAEYRHAKQKNVPLVIAVKNFLTGEWWMHWVSVDQLEEFSGIPTPVNLAEDGEDARKFLRQSVQSVKEKLQSLMG